MHDTAHGDGRLDWEMAGHWPQWLDSFRPSHSRPVICNNTRAWVPTSFSRWLPRQRLHVQIGTVARATSHGPWPLLAHGLPRRCVSFPHLLVALSLGFRLPRSLCLCALLLLRSLLTLLQPSTTSRSFVAPFTRSE